MMKTRLPFLVILTLFFVSCTNLDDIYNRLDDHEARLKKLETMTTEANNTIMSLQQLVDAQAKKISIVSYSALPNGEGYKLIMSDGSEIILKHGSDGQTPDIGVKMVDGVLYWTLNGELMRDALGNPIPAKGEKGEDGQNGVTPQLRVNLDGFWEVSLDGGKVWQVVKDANGQPVSAEGKDGNSDLAITDNRDGTITIVFGGQTFVIPVATGGGTDPQPERPKMAIEYFAEYNVAADGTSFATSHANKTSGYYTWDDAVANFGSAEGVTIDNIVYALPTKEELQGIFPGLQSYLPVLRFSTNLTITDFAERVSIGGVVKDYTADYRSTPNLVGYGIRFKSADNSQLSAWRYERKDNPDGGTMTTVTVRYLGPNKATTTLDEIANETWWNTNNLDDVVRIFPSSGVYPASNNTVLQGLGEYAMYWTSSSETDTSGVSAYLYSGGVYCDHAYSGKATKMTIRLIEKAMEPSPNRPKLSIEYMAEYNINPAGDGFVTTNSNIGSGFFNYADAKLKFEAINIGGTNYHLPSPEEWRGILNDDRVRFKDRDASNDVEEEIQIGKDGVKTMYKADYVSPENYVSYGLRFKGGDNSMLSAWRYQCIEHPEDPSATNMLVVITVRYLGPDFTDTIDDIAQPGFWESDNAHDIVREVPLSGWINVDEELQEKGSAGRFFCMIPVGNYSWYAFFTSYSCGLQDTLYDWYYMLKDKFTIRLFVDRLD